MTRKDLGTIASDHKWGIAIIGGAAVTYAASLFWSDLKANTDVMAVVLAVVGFIRTWLESQTRQLQQSSQNNQRAVVAKVDASNEVIDTRMQLNMGLVTEAIGGLRSDLNEKHAENQSANDAILATMEKTRTEEVDYRKANDRAHAEHRERFAAIETRLGHGDDQFGRVEKMIADLTEHVKAMAPRETG